MNGLMFTAFLCGLLSAAAASKVDFWWSEVKTLIQDPCTPDTGSSTVRQQEPTVSLADTSAPPASKQDCLPLNLSRFAPLTREGRDIAGQLLKDKRARRWVRGRWSGIARAYRCQLHLCIPVRKRSGLNRAQMKVAEDLIQLASYAYYVDNAVTTIKSKKNVNIKRTLQELSRKMKVTACSLREAVNKPTLLPYVTSDDVPADLRHKKRGRKERVATYVITENIETFLRELAGTYKRNGIKVCGK